MPWMEEKKERRQPSRQTTSCRASPSSPGSLRGSSGCAPGEANPSFRPDRRLTTPAGAWADSSARPQRGPPRCAIRFREFGPPPRPDQRLTGLAGAFLSRPRAAGGLLRGGRPPPSASALESRAPLTMREEVHETDDLPDLGHPGPGGARGARSSRHAPAGGMRSPATLRSSCRTCR